jgi:hypothetical protein
MVVAATEFGLFVVRIDARADSSGLAKIKRRARDVE